MQLEIVKRWRCSKCNYVTFTFPPHGDCMNCSFGQEYSEDVIPLKDPPKKRKYTRRKVKNAK